jgi:hypothetical protein
VAIIGAAHTSVLLDRSSTALRDSHRATQVPDRGQPDACALIDPGLAG